jgi:DNA primase
MENQEKEIEVIVGLIGDILGQPVRAYESKHQYLFNCPLCDEDQNKGNLEVSLIKHLYHCWSCGDESDKTHGPLGKLFDVFGTKKQKKIYDLIKPQELKVASQAYSPVRLPEGFITFQDSNPIYIPHKESLSYLKSRGISDETIAKYKMGYTVKGDFAYRIIIPSYDKDGKLNYFLGRSWVKGKIKYKNATAPKDEIIFNEHLINWTEDIYLTEGVFDSIFLPNSIPLLGKHVSDKLFNLLYDKAEKDIIVCLDGDAYKDSLKLYNNLNGGKLYDRIKLVKLPYNKDVCELKGDIDNYYVKIK